MMRYSAACPSKPMPGRVGQLEIAVLQPRVVGEAREGAEHAGIGFRAAQAEAAGDVQRHLVAAVREQAGARPVVARQHVERAGVLHDAVGLRRIDLDDVAARGLQPAEPHQVLDVLGREQVLAGRQRAVVGSDTSAMVAKSSGSHGSSYQRSL